MKFITFLILLLIVPVQVLQAKCSYKKGSTFILGEGQEFDFQTYDVNHANPIKATVPMMRAIRVKGSHNGGCIVDLFTYEDEEKKLNNVELFVASESLGSLEEESIELLLMRLERGGQASNNLNPPEKCCEGKEGQVQIDPNKVPRPKVRPRARPRREVQPDGTKIIELQMSNNGLKFIKEFEGFDSHFYPDGTSRCSKNDGCKRACYEDERVGTKVGIPAVGYGVQIPACHNVKSFCRRMLGLQRCGPNYSKWLYVLKNAKSAAKGSGRTVVNKQQATRLMVSVVRRKENQFKKDFPHLKLKQTEYDALVSLYYNYPKAFRVPCKTEFCKELKKENPSRRQLAWHLHDIGPLQGHFKRRLREINLLLLGQYPLATKRNQIPTNENTRALYKRVISSWDDKARKDYAECRKTKSKSRCNWKKAFWITNREYRFFVNEVSR